MTFTVSRSRNNSVHPYRRLQRLGESMTAGELMIKHHYKSLNSMISTYKNPLYGTLGTFQKRDFKSQYLFVWKRLDPCHIFGWVVFFHYPKYFQRCPNRDKSTSTTRRKIRKNSTEWVKSLILATLKGLSLFFFRFSVCALTLPGPVKGHK